ncbi:MAG: phosphatidylserine decarboxylase proenzyme [Pelagibacteraceae bacterium]|jgi:phosphatidylserine decarboxylase|nr:MAG: phosphatidylserine decarboxylase proenzyme [Pelagibacteraceae bacterium]|tara:strand:+ start:1514 stop:2176 length:663 start_codon:yes stop_codon:yes gene_type:complete
MYFRFHKEISAALIILFLLVIFFYFIYKPLFLIFLILLIFTFYFFRDPERVVPLGDDILVSPADGLITNISEYKEGKKSYTKVSIFLSVFNVHIQRLPVSGQITKIDYIEGKFINATLDKASEENERLRLTLKSGSNVIYITQIAGLIARRIICYLKTNERVNQGERYGIIKFGSRVDIEFPNSYNLMVSIGQQCIGGETIIARDFKNNKNIQSREYKKI